MWVRRKVPLMACLLALALPLTNAIDMEMYSKLPKLFDLEDYDACMATTNGSYCLVDIELAAEQPNTVELLSFMKEFSSGNRKKWTYRHDVLHRGVCRSSCEKGLEECALRELRTQGWGGIVRSPQCQGDYGDPIGLTHWLFLTVVGLIILANIASSIYRAVTKQSSDAPARGLVRSFSIQDNWPLLTRHSSIPGAQCLRFITMVMVISSHSSTVIIQGFVSNTESIEHKYSLAIARIAAVMSFVVHTFFCLSSFFMTLNFLKNIEKYSRFSIWLYPNYILNRWLRLVPSYAIIIWFMCTWFEHTGEGPLWETLINRESLTCRHTWWHNLLFIRNLMGRHRCVHSAWYLEVDFQLFCVCMVVLMVIWLLPKSAKPLFVLTLGVGVITPGALTLFNDYFPYIFSSPEDLREFSVNDEVSVNVYTQMYGNLTGYALGMIAGYMQYHIEKNQMKVPVLKIKLSMYSSLLNVAGCLLGALHFGSESYVSSPFFGSMYAASYKPAFGGFIAVFILTMANNVTSVIRTCVEWIPSEALGRLSYSAFLIHPIIQKIFIASQKKPLHYSDYFLLHFNISSIVMSYMLAIPLWLLVEMPFANLMVFLMERQKRTSPKTEQNNSETRKAGAFVITVPESVEENSRL